MGFFTRMMSVVTLGSSRPIRRLAAYYALLAIVGLVVFQFFPGLDGLLTGDRLSHLAKAPAALLRDSIATAQSSAPPADFATRATFALSTAFILLSTLALMLPVTWVYMSARAAQGHNQSVVQVLIVLPMIVAGVVLIVSNSLALAFSLGGVVAAVRFRTNMADSRDIVFIFLAIAVGFAAGVQDITIAVMLSLIFNFVLVFLWRSDFGRTMLEPTASSQWAEPLGDLAGKDHGGNTVPDRDLVLALTPKKVEALAERFERVRVLLGPNGKKPRFDAVLAVTTSEVDGAQKHIEKTLNTISKRWKLDEVVTNTGKASELFYLVRARKSTTTDALLTAIRAGGNGSIESANVEVGDAVAVEEGQIRDARKVKEQRE